MMPQMRTPPDEPPLLRLQAEPIDGRLLVRILNALDDGFYEPNVNGRGRWRSHAEKHLQHPNLPPIRFGHPHADMPDPRTAAGIAATCLRAPLADACERGRLDRLMRTIVATDVGHDEELASILYAPTPWTEIRLDRQPVGPSGSRSRRTDPFVGQGAELLPRCIVVTPSEPSVVRGRINGRLSILIEPHTIVQIARPDDDAMTTMRTFEDALAVPFGRTRHGRSGDPVSADSHGMAAE